MLLAIDMGNTNIEVGLMDGEQLISSDRIATDLRKTETEYAVLLHTIFEIRGIDPAMISGSIISSVVPPLTHIIREAVKRVTKTAPLVVGPGIRTGLKIRIDNPKELGADLVVGSVAAIELYGSPVIVIDMGTATTLCAIGADSSYLGGILMPGINLSMNALADGTSQLPRIALEAPKKVIGSNTVTAIQSGMIFGQASLLDGMSDRIEEECGYPMQIVATGGLAKIVVPHMKRKVILDSELMIKGLRIIYEKNR